MPRKPRLKPAPADTLPAEPPAAAPAAADVPLGDAAEPAHTPPAALDFALPAAAKRPFVWARIDGPVGIKVETETEWRPGIAHARTLIRFCDDGLPTPAEKARLREEGFKYCPDVQAWGCQKSAATLEVAKRLAGELARGRGDAGVGLYI